MKVKSSTMTVWCVLASFGCFVALLFPVVSGHAAISSGSLKFKKSEGCPCSNPDWCDPITDTTRQEIFAFSISNDTEHWSKYDWSKLTTVVMVGYVSDHLMCMAHALNTRVSYIPKMDINFQNPTARKSWVEEQLSFIQMHHLDGINFDYESAIAENNSTMRDAYTSLVAETNAVLKKVLPTSQVTVDVAWRPNIDRRYYDYKGLAEHSDFLFVMAYDEQSQIFEECVAMPNSGFVKTVEGVSAYMSAGIPASQLVLGLPWYGYVYPCIQMDGDKCSIKPVPFRGAYCSDAAGKQYTYSYIKKKSGTHTVQWNETSSTPFFTFTTFDMSQTFQVQFDNPRSLTMKYDTAQKMKLRGVGMWNIDTLNYDDSPDGRACRREMFGALPRY